MSLPFKFFIDDDGAKQIALQWLENDIRTARLSRTFQLYYCLRPFIPLWLRQKLQSSRELDIQERWYIPDAFLLSLQEYFAGRDELLRVVHPWPHGADFAFVLTHDVETSDGVKLIDRVAKIEEELGFRSSWNLIPYKYKIDKGLIRDLQARGFEIGVHGYNHDGKLFFSQRTFQRRAKYINEALREYGAVGFRSPMVHRNLSWLQSLDVEYDSSCFDIDPFQAMPGGVGSIWPFECGRFVELPYTLPQDHTLFIALGQEDCRIWTEKLAFIKKHSGMALMLTHPDYLSSLKRLELYREFLIMVREQGNHWHARPSEVAKWWKHRANSTVESTSNGYEIQGPTQQLGVCATVDGTDDGLTITPEMQLTR